MTCSVRGSLKQENQMMTYWVRALLPFIDPDDVDRWTWTWRNCSPLLSSVRKVGGWSGRLNEDFLDTEGEAGSLTTLSTRVADTGSASSTSLSESVSSQ